MCLPNLTLTNIENLAESELHQVMSLWKIGFNVACIATILWASVLPTAKAIYFANQEPPENYPFAGFLITELVNPPNANEKYLICGANFVSLTMSSLLLTVWKLLAVWQLVMVILRSPYSKN